MTERLNWTELKWTVRGIRVTKDLLCCCSDVKLCPTLWDPMDCNTLGSSVLHFLPPRVCSNSCPLSQWCYLIISSSAAHFSFCLLSFPASGSFPVSWVFPSGCRSIELALQHQSFQWMNIQNWFPLGLTGLISLQSKGLSGVLSRTIVQKHQFFGTGDWNLSGSRGNCLGYLIKS